MAKTKWGMIYNDDALGIDDMLHFVRCQNRRGLKAFG